ncbi:hypothetical protein KFK09_004536 [Dendrobium nobile]|uniref:Uncharacterized protein n=1 Tax=Dendrobium nobile TaxID=94219 RepID=A0A8T3C358_DENNO|nr:hypothetical protein KFK09_004536 [Dendrobium nobile]
MSNISHHYLSPQISFNFLTTISFPKGSTFISGQFITYITSNEENTNDSPNILKLLKSLKQSLLRLGNAHPATPALFSSSPPRPI